MSSTKSFSEASFRFILNLFWEKMGRTSRDVTLLTPSSSMLDFIRKLVI